MIITQKNVYEMMRNPRKTNYTEVLRHATMQRTEREKRKRVKTSVNKVKTSVNKVKT